MVLAVGVLLAPYREAANVRVSLVAHLARANGMVVYDLTVSVWSTVTWHAAHTVNAGLFHGTVRVGAAAGRDGDVDQLARPIVGCDVAFGTDAYHGSHRHRVHDVTQRGLITRVEHVAGIDAVLVDARSFAGAVTVHLTLRPGRISFWRFVLAHNHRMAVWLVCRAAAARCVLEDVAFGVRSTLVVVEAWVHTLAVDARLSGGALRVTPASYHKTLDEWVTLQARRTAALGSVFLCVALSTDGTRVVHQARVDAGAGVAHLVIGTLFVRATAG